MKDMIGRKVIIDRKTYTVEDSAMLGEATQKHTGAHISLTLRGIRGALKLAFMDVYSGQTWMVV